MFAHVFSRRTSFLVRCFHAAKRFSNPDPENILFSALCLNLKQRRWNTLNQFSPSLTNPLISRVLRELRTSPKLALEFYNWVLENQTPAANSSENRFEASCVMIQLLVDSRKFDDALSIMTNLMSVEGGNLSPLQVLSGLIRNHQACCDSTSLDVFDSLVRACTQNGDAEGASKVIEQARAEGFCVSLHALNNFMGCLLNLNEIDWFWKVYREMDSLGYVENVNTFNLVIYSFCKEGKLLEALSVFYRMLKCGVWPNVVSFNMMIDGACKSGDMVFALRLLWKMGVMSGSFVSPNAVTYNSVINGFCKVGRLDLAERIRNVVMVKSGVEWNERTYGALVDGYGRGGSLDEALRLCDEMTSKGLVANTVICNSVVYWMFMEGDVEGAMLVLSDMVDKRMEIDRFTQAIVVRGLFRNGCVEEAVKFREEKLVVEDVVCHNTLMHHLVTCGDQILGSMVVRGLDLDVVSFATLIDGYVKEGKLEKAVEVYDGMVKMKKTPNLVVYNSVVNGLCKRGLVGAAEAVVEAMERKDVVTYNTLLNESLRSGNVEEAVDVLARMVNQEGERLVSVVTYNIVINHLCKFGCYEKAKEVLEVMVERGVVPDFVTYGTLITSFSKNRGEEEVVELHDYMVLHGVTPHEQIFRSVVSPLLDGENEKCLKET
ncbi:unnamed protein product [Microthlaspi erraticum]|uniref:Pentacotripeptide-repeat region of PRORP domain-containing protein n=1 Tax=Microthlaspi erraticum TaxID=1685480 RepID=A0A6D2JFD8_9BRAS|nr:unnamed protein product [Microthlaspi erraticum]